MKGLIEGDDSQIRNRRKCGEVGVRPILRRRASQARHGTECVFNRGRLGQERHSAILKPAVVSLPSRSLTHDFVTHDGLGRQQAKQTKLGDATEKEASVGLE